MLVKVQKHNTNFVMLQKTALNLPNLDWDAKGLWAYLMGHDDSWEISVRHLAKYFNSGEKHIRSMLRKLIAAKLCIYTQKRHEKGRFLKGDFTLFEVPYEQIDDQKQPISPDKNGFQKISPKAPKRHAVKARAVKGHINKEQVKQEIKNNNNIPEPQPPKELFPPPCFTPSASPPSVVVVSFLESLNLPNELKQKVSRQHSAEDIEIAVKRVLAWEGRSCDSKALMCVLKNKLTWTDSVGKKGKEEQQKEAYRQKCEKEEQERIQKYKDILKKKAEDEARAEENRKWMEDFKKQNTIFFDQDHRFDIKNAFVKVFSGDSYNPIIPFSDVNFRQYVQKNYEKMQNRLKVS